MNGFKRLTVDERIMVRHRPGAGPAAGLMAWRGRTISCRLGRSGISSTKREGDGATPRGGFRLLEAFYRADRVARPRTVLPCTAIRPDWGWCDQPFDANYNRPVWRPYPASHEAMWRADGLYDIVVVLDYNIRPRVQGLGSAIFLHLSLTERPATEGCVALKEPELRQLLAGVGSDTVLVVD